MGILLTAGILVLAALLFFVIFQTKTVEVTGNERYTEDEIRQIVEQQEPLSFNTVLLTFFPVHADFSGVPFLETISYELVSPSAVRAVVEEKVTAGYVEVDGQKAYFDGEGIVLECIPVEEETEQAEESLDTQPVGDTEEQTQEQGEALDSESLPTARVDVEEYDPNLEDIPEVTGLNVTAAVVGEQLPVEHTEIFEELDALTRLLDRFDLWPEQVEVTEDWELILHYPENIRILLGSDAYLEEKITKLSGILPQLDGLSGELHLEDVDERSGDALFSQDTAEPDAGQETQEGGETADRLRHKNWKNA